MATQKSGRSVHIEAWQQGKRVHLRCESRWLDETFTQHAERPRVIVLECPEPLGRDQLLVLAGRMVNFLLRTRRQPVNVPFGLPWREIQRVGSVPFQAEGEGDGETHGVAIPALPVDLTTDANLGTRPSEVIPSASEASSSQHLISIPGDEPGKTQASPSDMDPLPGLELDAVQPGPVGDQQPRSAS